MISVYLELRGYSADGGTLSSSKFRGRTKHVLAGRANGIGYLQLILLDTDSPIISSMTAVVMTSSTASKLNKSNEIQQPLHTLSKPSAIIIITVHMFRQGIQMKRYSKVVYSS